MRAEICILKGRMPHLSVILNENLKEERYGSRAPDLVIEIVSRDDGGSALFEKAKLYNEFIYHQIKSRSE